MRRIYVLTLIFVIGFFISSCSTLKNDEKQTVPSLPGMPVSDKTGEQGVQDKDGNISGLDKEKVDAKELTAKDLKKEEVKSDTVKNEAVENPLEKDILFDYDRYDIRTEDKKILSKIASFLIENINIKILIEGNCDERGTYDYNLVLGDRRAKAAKDYLVVLGVAKDRIDTVSYGEERPVCSEETEECWQKNRRAHFVVSNK